MFVCSNISKNWSPGNFWKNVVLSETYREQSELTNAFTQCKLRLQQAMYVQPRTTASCKGEQSCFVLVHYGIHFVKKNEIASNSRNYVFYKLKYKRN